jgi:hypothetical protein
MNTQKQVRHYAEDAIQKVFFPNENARQLFGNRYLMCLYCPKCACHVMKIIRVGTIIGVERKQSIEGTYITGRNESLCIDQDVLEIVFSCCECKQNFSIEFKQTHGCSNDGSHFEFEVLENVSIPREEKL